ncbi:BolA family protein [Haliea atlantica]|nr:BolA family transcriptional regulator [Haliea sp.]|tara:strand:+ start:13263 stop:13589 length:327 start_codon:yes stop_codon:yes gene_type:complete
MVIQQQIESRLREALSPEHLELENESHMHSVPPGSESHFRLVLVSEAFAGQRKVARHQRIYQLLAEELAGPVHALSIFAWTPEEWRQRGEPAPASPQCMGGSKREQGA